MTWPIIAKFQNIFWWISFQHVSMIFSWVQNRHWTVVEFLIKYGSYVLTFWENHSSFTMDAQRYVIKLLKYVWPHESEPLLSIDSFSIMIECVCCEWIEGHFFGFDHFKGYSCWLNRGMETFFLAKYVIKAILRAEYGNKFTEILTKMKRNCRIRFNHKQNGEFGIFWESTKKQDTLLKLSGMAKSINLEYPHYHHHQEFSLGIIASKIPLKYRLFDLYKNISLFPSKTWKAVARKGSYISALCSYNTDLEVYMNWCMLDLYLSEIF